MFSFNEILFLCASFLGTVVSAMFGFGNALISLPIAMMVLPTKKAIVIITVFFAFSNISKIIMFHKYIDWEIVKRVIKSMIPSVIIGAILMKYAPNKILERTLGIMTIIYVINEYFKVNKLKITKKIEIFASILYGFFSGIIGTGSTIIAGLFTQLGLTKERFIATVAITTFVLNLIKITIYSRYNLISKSDVPLIISLIFIAFLGVYTGKRLLKRINTHVFKSGVLLILFIIGVKLLF